jgi:hypothetical protein
MAKSELYMGQSSRGQVSNKTLFCVPIAPQTSPQGPFSHPISCPKRVPKGPFSDTDPHPIQLRFRAGCGLLRYRLQRQHLEGLQVEGVWRTRF